MSNLSSNISNNVSADGKDRANHVKVSLAHVDATQILLKDLSYAVGPKVILDDINTVFQPGRLSVIVGPSGSGKTTLLSLIAGLQGNAPVQAHRTGEILFNGHTLSPETIRRIVGFVFQDDVILETMTVEEAIDMSVKLRVALPNAQTGVALKNRMIDLSQLEKSKDVIIGSPMKKGISGGEKKRLAVAMELVSNPSVLLLDEPTSGLDAYTAYRTVALLKRLANKYGRTVVATLHQPSSEIYHMVDDLYVLHEGKLVYGGPGKELVPYFTGAGYHFDQYSNPLDVLFMDILNQAAKDEFAHDDGYTGVSQEGKHGILGTTDDQYVPLQSLAAYYKSSPMYNKFLLQAVIFTRGTTKGVLRFRAKKWRAFRLLYVRDMRNVWRNPMVIRTKLFQTTFLAAFIAIAFTNTRFATPPALFQNIAGILLISITNQFFSSFQNILPVFSGEKASFTREHSQGYYGVTSYFFAKILVELPLTIIFPIITSVIIYWSVGLRPGFIHWFYYTVILQLVALTGFSMGLLSACLFNNLAVALALSIVFLIPFMIFAGLFLNLNSVPAVLSWLAWVSPMHYGYSLLFANQFVGWEVPGAEAYYNSTSVATGLPYWLDAVILFCIFLGALVAAYFALFRVVLKNEGRSVRKLFHK